MATKAKTKSSKKRLTKKEKKRKKSISIISIVLVIVLLSGLAGYKVGTTHHKSFDYESVFGTVDLANGVDVSHHNGKIDWDVLKDNVDFAIIRCAYRGYSTGKILTDDTFKHNIKSANKAKVPIGVYFYTQALNTKEAEEEARYVINLVKDYDISLPIFIDFEYSNDEKGDHSGRLYEANLTDEESTDIINAFCNKVKKAGYIPGVYASSSMYSSKMNANDITSDAVIWVADYNTSVTYAGDYNIWQCSKSGSVDGILSSNVDIDKWYRE